MRISLSLRWGTGLGICLGAVVAIGTEGHAGPLQQLPAVRIDVRPVAPSPNDGDRLLPGTGLCAAFRTVADPWIFPTRMEWPKDAYVLPTKFNDVMDGLTGTVGPRRFQTLLSPFDLSNFNRTGDDAAGDFTNAGCADPFGCPFPGAAGADLSRSFVTRFRGFLNVRPEWIKRPMHFGFFAETAVAMSIFAVEPPNWFAYQVISRAVEGGASRYRVTNTVTFANSGLYPVEIVHAQYSGSAILEFAVMFDGPDFQDMDQVADAMQPKLSQQPYLFQLDTTGPTSFFQSTSGYPPYADLSECQQCPRRWANVPGQPSELCNQSDGEPARLFCNEAAVCAPCLTDSFCGLNCSPCEVQKPYCFAPSGLPSKAFCVECRIHDECPAGQFCLSGECQGRRPDMGQDIDEPVTCHCSNVARRSSTRGGDYLLILLLALWAGRRRSLRASRIRP